MIEKTYNRRTRRALFASKKRKNNRTATAGRVLQLVPKYTEEEIKSATTTIERLRRERSFHHIQHIC